MELRNNERIRTNLPVMLRAVDGYVLPGIVRNLGESGLFIETRESLPVDTPVVITLDLSRHMQTPRERFTGIVIHGKNGGIGLRTEGVDTSVRDKVLRCAGQRSQDKNKVSCWYVTNSYEVQRVMS